jgi:hypothetical protein
MPFRREDVEALIRLTDEALARQEDREGVLARAEAIVRGNDVLQASEGIDALSDCTVSGLILLLIEN